MFHLFLMKKVNVKSREKVFFGCGGNWAFISGDNVSASLSMIQSIKSEREKWEAEALRALSVIASAIFHARPNKSSARWYVDIKSYVSHTWNHFSAANPLRKMFGQMVRAVGDKPLSAKLKPPTLRTLIDALLWWHVTFSVLLASSSLRHGRHSRALSNGGGGREPEAWWAITTPSSTLSLLRQTFNANLWNKKLLRQTKSFRKKANGWEHPHAEHLKRTPLCAKQQGRTLARYSGVDVHGVAIGANESDSSSIIHFALPSEF